MGIVVIVLILLAAAGLGLAANYISGVLNEEKDPKAGSSVQNVLNGTALLAAFIIALVLSGTAGSYSSADKASKQEADTVDNLYESAEYVDQPYRQALQASMVCYARAVAGPEWETLASGKRSPVPSNWTGTGPHGVRKTLIQMGATAKGFGLVQAADQKRGELRSERVVQANPTVPSVEFWLMILLIALSIGGLAYSIPRQDNTPQIVAVIAVTLLFITTVLLIRNLDRPFSGVLAQKPTAMLSTAQDDSKAYMDRYGDTLPCNDRGEPLPS